MANDAHTSCEDCSAGTHRNSSQDECTDCLGLTYTAESGQENCLECTAVSIVIPCIKQTGIKIIYLYDTKFANSLLYKLYLRKIILQFPLMTAPVWEFLMKLMMNVRIVQR